MKLSLSKRLAAGLAAAAVGLTTTACGGGGGGDTAGDFDGEIKVGILHSLSGTMAISETTLKETEEMAIKEINDAGGVKIDGKSYKIKSISEDGASDWPTFAEKSQKLIDADGVAVVFGGWTSASRKAMLPVYEAKDHFLFYPIQYEGQECSKNIFYTGAVPNQQAEPAVDWLFEKFSDKLGKKVYLVGSDYVYPRTANTIIKEQVKSLGGETVGEDYIPLGNTEVAPIIAKIKKAFPDGGIIICGEARDWSGQDSIPQQAWLMKLDSFGCLVPGCQLIDATEEAQEQGTLLLYPNPARDYLNFFYRPAPGQNSRELSFRIFDASGRELQRFEAQSGEATYIVPLWHWPPGVYFLQLLHDGLPVRTERFVVGR